MISVVLYGRNDSHGYNLHKRAAISLNCIAEVLSDPGDEILFVDCNTPNDLPTFIEAIYDTLSPRAKQFLRVFRLRPELYARLVGQTHLFATEPHTRNIALRRSNPRNRWVLSTNTDMIFVPDERLLEPIGGGARSCGRALRGSAIRIAGAVVGVVPAQQRARGHAALRGIVSPAASQRGCQARAVHAIRFAGRFSVDAAPGVVRHLRFR